MEWSDIRVLLAIARAGTLGAAARQLGKSQPTMGRRLKALESALGHTLFQRTGDGFVLTEEGEIAFAHAERMEEEALAIHRSLAGTESGLAGLIRVSCSDWFGVYMLSPVLAELAELHPRITVELLTDPRIYSLPRRDADLVYRIKAFDDPEVVARRLLNMEYGVYKKRGALGPTGDGSNASLVLMDTAFGDMPDVDWILRKLPKARVVSRSNNREVQARLCALGVGLAVLPRPLAELTSGLEEVHLGEMPPPRETWVGYHRDMRRNAKLRALLDLSEKRLSN